MLPTPRRPLVIGNWKMHGLKQSAVELERLILGVAALAPRLDTIVCPPATLIAQFADVARGSAVAIGGQDCHREAAGAFTGDISAEMLADAGATAVIVGHSERRAYHHERNADVRAKAAAALRAGLAPIVCIGETQEERSLGHTFSVITRQLKESLPDLRPGAAIVVAYEPVWAIGSGLTPTTEDIAAVHAAIRDALLKRFAAAGEAIRILYGGSVKRDNAKALLSVAGVDGALVGGASLKAEEFLGILESAPT